MQTYSPAGFGPLIASNFPEVKMFTRYNTWDPQPLLRCDDKFLEAKPLAVADKDFFKMFSFTFVQGDADAVLSRPLTIVIAKSIAENYFPKGDALGKIVRYDNVLDLEIAGVFEDIPPNYTHAI
jgi:putative ABC transport system permease protein